jgi:hypothetical protein
VSKTFKVQVSSIVSSRYKNIARPDSWDERVAGKEVIQTTCGKTLELFSDGQQSTPQPGWVIMVEEGVSTPKWTLFGMPS